MPARHSRPSRFTLLTLGVAVLATLFLVTTAQAGNEFPERVSGVLPGAANIAAR